MAWKFIKFNKNVSQKECQEFLSDEIYLKLWSRIRIQKTCANGIITLKIYPHEGVALDDALKDAKALISMLSLDFLEVEEQDIT